jgi:transcriptional regulator with XRE-family HTH domain
MTEPAPSHKADRTGGLTAHQPRGSGADPELIEFGEQLHWWRRFRGMTLEALAGHALVSFSLIQKIEKALRWPPEGLAQRCDNALGTGGALEMLMPAVDTARLRHDLRRRESRATRRSDTPATVAERLPQTVTSLLSGTSLLPAATSPWVGGSAPEFVASIGRR